MAKRSNWKGTEGKALHKPDAREAKHAFKKTHNKSFTNPALVKQSIYKIINSSANSQ